MASELGDVARTDLPNTHMARARRNDGPYAAALDKAQPDGTIRALVAFRRSAINLNEEFQ